MMIFLAFYFYFLIQVIMATKWDDSSLTINNLKDKMSWVPSMVGKSTEDVKKKISDGSVVVKEKVKNLKEKAGKTLKDWTDYVIDKCKNLKTKLTGVQLKSPINGVQLWSIDQKSVSELVETNKELVDLTKKLIEKYDETLKVLNEISQNLWSAKTKTKSEKK